MDPENKNVNTCLFSWWDAISLLYEQNTHRRSHRARGSSLALLMNTQARCKHWYFRNELLILSYLQLIKYLNSWIMKKYSIIWAVIQTLVLACYLFFTGCPARPPRYRGLPSGPMMIPGSPFSPLTKKRYKDKWTNNMNCHLGVKIKILLSCYLLISECLPRYQMTVLCCIYFVKRDINIVFLQLNGWTFIIL